MEEPQYKHDCDRCVFLGRYWEYDLYHCGDERSRLAGSLIARSSSEGADYASMPVSLADQSSHPELRVARTRYDELTKGS